MVFVQSRVAMPHWKLHHLIGEILDLNETAVKRLLLTAYGSLRMTLGRYDPEKGRN